MAEGIYDWYFVELFCFNFNFNQLFVKEADYLRITVLISR